LLQNKPPTIFQRLSNGVSSVFRRFYPGPQMEMEMTPTIPPTPPPTPSQSQTIPRKNEFANYSSPLVNYSSSLTNHSNPLANYSSSLTNHSNPLVNYSSPLVDQSAITSSRFKNVPLYPPTQTFASFDESRFLPFASKTNERNALDEQVHNSPYI
jgi:hypothetical protein